MSTLATPGLARETSVLVFLQPFKAWMDDPEVTEIAVNAPGVVWVEAHSTWTRHACPEAVGAQLRALGTAVATYSNQKWDETAPILSASMPDGSRIQLVMPPAVEEGRYSFTMRKPSRLIRGIEDFAAEGLFRKVRPMQGHVSAQDQELLDLLNAEHYEEFIKQSVR